MATAFEVEATIGGSVEEVWATLTDWEHAPRWMRGVDSMRADGANLAGTRLSFRARGKDRLAEITECETGRRITLRSVQGGVRADYRYELRRIDGDVTHITLTAECQSDTLLWRYLSPILRLAIRLTDGRQLEALKQLVEGR